MANNRVLFAFNSFFLASFCLAVLGGMGPSVLADAMIGSFSADSVWVVSDCDSLLSLIMRSCVDIVKRGQIVVLGFGSADVVVVALSFVAGSVVGFQAGMVDMTLTSCGGVPSQRVML
ncbi:hypothetical protein Tco_0086470 [Tanacetum coccineum]